MCSFDILQRVPRHRTSLPVEHMGGSPGMSELADDGKGTDLSKVNSFIFGSVLV